MKEWNFFILRLSSPLHKRKAPRLKTFWRRFWQTINYFQKMWKTFVHSWSMYISFKVSPLGVICIGVVWTLTIVLQ